MGYFAKPQSEEDLKEQYRRLLIKYDYRSTRNQSVIEDITREYKQLLRQLKTESVKKVVKEASDSYQSFKSERLRKKAEEDERIKRLRYKNYSNQEIQTMIIEIHKLLDIILKKALKDNEVLYISLSNMSYKYDEINLCRWFHVHIHSFASLDEIESYDGIREELEYALKGRAMRDGKPRESIISAYEKLLGQYINKKLKEYEDLYVDPIKIVKRQQEEKKGTYLIAYGLSILQQQ